MKLTKEEVNKVAHLARLELSEEETERMTGDMNNILDYINKLSELNTDNVEPTCHAVPVTNVFREDVQRNDFTIEEALANAPSSEEGSFKVPKVIE
ncbi:MAG: Asp-tRNA(Asn)/Glu-tRNA(Gln) amidotransferase subunit GatC [Proteobacteria bacterium]|nr:Asp-tRNA(Asn)/Glu-tRNA(Gln) amidotransferase subunit GatC [Pseudomonadota bacterium]